MGGVIFVLAIVVIVCFIYWKKSQNKRIPEGKKSIEKVNEANNYKKENLHKTSDNSNGLSNNEDLERKNKKEVYDASRKKDRGKKRREKKKSNEIKSEVKTEEVKEEKKVKANESKKETKIENQDIDVKVSHEADKVKEDAQASKENSEDLGKNLKKEDQIKAKEVKEEKTKTNESKKETKIENQDIDVKVSHEADKVKEDAQASKENSETKTKDLKEKNQVKTDKVKEEKITKSQEVKEEKVKTDESKKETKIENQDIDVKASHEADKVKEDAQASKENPEDLGKNLKKENQIKPEEVKEEKVKTEEIKKEKISEPEEIKREKENLKITNEKYSDLISSLKNNPWKKEDLNTKVKLENTRTKKTISEEEIDNLPLEKIKSSLSPEAISDFLNTVKTNPTILNRKDDTAYEFTSRNADEIASIKNRYGLLEREIDKITSVLIFDKDLKLKEVKDILAEGKNRIYMETKF